MGRLVLASAFADPHQVASDSFRRFCARMSASLFPAGVNVLEHVTAATPDILLTASETRRRPGFRRGRSDRCIPVLLRSPAWHIRLAIGRLNSSYSKLCVLILIEEAGIVGHPSLEEDREV